MLNLRYSENAGLNKTPVTIHLLAPFYPPQCAARKLSDACGPCSISAGQSGTRTRPSFLPTPHPQSSSGALWIICIGSSLPELPVAHPGLWPSAW